MHLFLSEGPPSLTDKYYLLGRLIIEDLETEEATIVAECGSRPRPEPPIDGGLHRQVVVVYLIRNNNQKHAR